MSVQGGTADAPVGVGIIGSQFISSIHAEALRACPQARLLGVASPTPGHAAQFAARHGIARHYTDYRELLSDPAISTGGGRCAQ